jgi:hypothetical protein
MQQESSLGFPFLFEIKKARPDFRQKLQSNLEKNSPVAAVPVTVAPTPMTAMPAMAPTPMPAVPVVAPPHLFGLQTIDICLRNHSRLGPFARRRLRR